MPTKNQQTRRLSHKNPPKSLPNKRTKASRNPLTYSPSLPPSSASQLPLGGQRRLSLRRLPAVPAPASPAPSPPPRLPLPSWTCTRRMRPPTPSGTCSRTRPPPPPWSVSLAASPPRSRAPRACLFVGWGFSPRIFALGFCFRQELGFSVFFLGRKKLEYRGGVLLSWFLRSRTLGLEARHVREFS